MEPPRNSEILRGSDFRVEQDKIENYYTIAKTIFINDKEYSVKCYFPKSNDKVLDPKTGSPSIFPRKDLTDPKKNLEVRQKLNDTIKKMSEYAKIFDLGTDKNLVGIRVQGNSIVRQFDESESPRTEVTDLIKTLTEQAEKHPDRKKKIESLINAYTKAKRAWENAKPMKSELDVIIEDFEVLENKEIDPKSMHDDEGYPVHPGKWKYKKEVKPEAKGIPQGEIVYLGEVGSDEDPVLESEEDLVKPYVPPKDRNLFERLFKIGEEPPKPKPPTLRQKQSSSKEFHPETQDEKPPEQPPSSVPSTPRKPAPKTPARSLPHTPAQTDNESEIAKPSSRKQSVASKPSASPLKKPGADSSLSEAEILKPAAKPAPKAPPPPESKAPAKAAAKERPPTPPPRSLERNPPPSSPSSEERSEVEKGEPPTPPPRDDEVQASPEAGEPHANDVDLESPPSGHESPDESDETNKKPAAAQAKAPAKSFLGDIVNFDPTRLKKTENPADSAKKNKQGLEGAISEAMDKRRGAVAPKDELTEEERFESDKEKEKDKP